MKHIYIIKTIISLFVLGIFFSCVDLNQEPQSTFPPEMYFTTESQLEAYVNNLYTSSPLPNGGAWDYGIYGIDGNSDNMTKKAFNNIYVPGQWKVGQSGGTWGFGYIYKCNFFFKNAQEKYDNGLIIGNKAMIDQYFGEVYFFRAFEYFNKVQNMGDFPIVKEPLEDNMEVLIEASKRAPRTEVVKFILEDLDKAISLLKEDPDGGHKNRISKYAAYILKSRVALHEATWMKYFKGTAFVPGGEGWPGAGKDYNKGYTIDNYDEYVNSLFQICMDASKIVAERFPLVENNNVVQQSANDPVNPYFNMFGDFDLSKFSEVILWREYSRTLGVTHGCPIAATMGGRDTGLTRGYVDNFLLDNGKPIYADPEYYGGDDYIIDVKKNRDGRLKVFLKEPGQKNILWDFDNMGFGQPNETYPDIIAADVAKGYPTGYSIRKGGNYSGTQLEINNGCSTGIISFRAAEALLNYMEACYEKNHSLDGTASQYWKQIRDRAKINNDFNITIAATDMNQEALNDWAAYSAGSLIDPTLYNIRRERRCELLAEGFRLKDLKRWRAIDRLVETPYHLEGFKLWGPMQHWYVDAEGKTRLVYEGLTPNVSAPSLSVYFRPHETNPNSLIWKQGGYKWAMAHYLDPIAIDHFLITGNGVIDNSPIYQNPYWPTRAGEGPIQ